MRKRVTALAVAATALTLTAAAAQQVPAPQAPTPTSPANDPDDGGRIVGGNPAGPDNVWQVEIFSTYRYTPADVGKDTAKRANGWFLAGQGENQRAHKCGGVYIGDNWILTAAHCLTEVAGDPLTTRMIRMGTRDLTAKGTVYKIERAVIHLDFDANAAPPLNDIALIRVDGNVIATKIRLLGDVAGDRPVGPGDNLRVTGWGYRKPRLVGATSLAADNTPNPPSPLLYQVNLTPKSAGCAAPAGYTDKMICAVGIKAGDDSCNGDSGGPMTHAQGKIRVLVGLVSWGLGCAQKGNPGVYTAVLAYRDWIVRAKAQSVAGTLNRIR